MGHHTQGDIPQHRPYPSTVATADAPPTGQWFSICLRDPPLLCSPIDRDRLKLFRLTWDVACSAFGGRQELYERFFFGDPQRMASALYQIYDKKPVMDQVREFLGR